MGQDNRSSLKEFECLEISPVNKAMLQVAKRLVDLRLGNSKIGNTQVKNIVFQDVDSLQEFVQSDLFPSVEDHIIFSVQQDHTEVVEHVEHFGQTIPITNTQEGVKFVSGLRMYDVKKPDGTSFLQINTNSWTEGRYADLSPEMMDEIFGLLNYPVIAYAAKGSSEIYYQNGASR